MELEHILQQNFKLGVFCSPFISFPLSRLFPPSLSSLRSAQHAAASDGGRSPFSSPLPPTVHGAGQTAAPRRRRGSAGLRGSPSARQPGQGVAAPRRRKGRPRDHAMVIPAALSSSLVVRSAVGASLAALIAARAVRRRSLDASGGIAGFVVMAVHIACGYRYGAVLMAFFFSSSKVTKIGVDRKRRVEEDFKEGGQRNWIQVLANSTVATILVVIFEIMTGGQDQCLDSNGSKIITGIIGGIIGHYCCCNGDTWSSEIGVLSDEQPRLITTLKPVRKGTNGGVTLQGLLAATGGGLIIGLTFVIVGLLTADCSFDMALRQLLVLPISAAAGLLGSLIDSLLGATLQFSGYCSVRKKIASRGHYCIEIELSVVKSSSAL
ncbi:hypothetical protein PAHAL_9G492600 [Panicum hallii]|uniref:DUF92 domain-containing protein n=2 Tax=Panicum hallii TaxID=206008 RepID=A0A2S3IRB2_9POAL|nr:hypothetical protein PAHAL_9G492600 [Panicum hallii]PAN50029.1 hypothetical protein PAHAL_9G492600 [Panicum hallii]